MKKFLFLSLLCSYGLFAQNNRKALSLDIAANETEKYTAAIPEGPYFVQPKILQLYCGEKVFIECEIAGDSIATMKVVEKVNFPDKTIEVAFQQDAEDKKNITTTLIVKNPFDKKLKYNAAMFTPKSQQWLETSIIPIHPKIMGYELWPHAIISLVLLDWRFEK